MKTALWNRLARVEAQAQPDWEPFEVWLGGEEYGTLEGPHGEVLTLAEFERRYPDAVDLSGPDASIQGGAR